MQLTVWRRMVAAILVGTALLFGGVAACEDDNDPPWPFSRP